MNLVRYFLVGACAAVVDFGLFAVAVLSLTSMVPCGCDEFPRRTAVNYLLSIVFVFESGVRFSKRNEWMNVFAVSGWGLIMNQAILWARTPTSDVASSAALLFFAKSAW